MASSLDEYRGRAGFNVDQMKEKLIGREILEYKTKVRRILHYSSLHIVVDCRNFEE